MYELKFIVMDAKERLFYKTKKNSKGCLEFTGALRNGYGAIKYKGKIWGAHRLSYFIINGFIHEHLLVCHKCDNPKCINPEHLFLGTYSENMVDCKIKERLVVPVGRKFKKGDYPKNASIPLEKAIEIKKMVLERGKETLKSLSIRLGLKEQFLRDISAGRILKDR